MRPTGKRPDIVGPTSGPEPPIPLRLDGKVIKGFGRGSKELGIPTANIPVEGLTVGGRSDVESGIYFGWAGLSHAPVMHLDGSDSDRAESGVDGARKEDPASGTHSGSSHRTNGTSSTKQSKALEASGVATEATTIPHPSGTNTESSPPQTAPSPRVYPMVMSIGWNPFYKNTKRSVEVHIMHDFGDRDFYGSHMNLCILGFIRPEYDYVSRDALVEDIRTDIEVARRSLDRDAYKAFKGEEYLVRFEGLGEIAV